MLAFIVLENLGLKDPYAHLFSHLAFAMPALGLFVTALRKWPRPARDRYFELARKVLLVGLAVAGGGQLIEGVGAFGYTGDESTNILSSVHPVGLGISTLGLLALMLGVGLALLLMIARSVGLDDRWRPVLVGVVAVGLVLFVAGSFIFGY